MKKGTVKFLKYNKFDHLYVKVDDEEFGWWRLENLNVAPEKRMMVRLDTDHLANDSIFTILPALGICVDLSNDRICVITNKTSNSVEVYTRKVSENGVDCRNWYTQRDFEKNFFTIPIDIEKKIQVDEPENGVLTERMNKQDVEQVKQAINKLSETELNTLNKLDKAFGKRK